MTELANYVHQMRRNIAGVEAAQEACAQVTAEYHARFPDDRAAADIAARSDARRKKAVGDDQYHQGLAVMYGVAALVELWKEPR